MSKPIPLNQLRLETIYSVFYELSQYEDGLTLLRKTKNQCKCTTNDIVQAQKLYKTTEHKFGNRITYSHTTIYDFGITNDDLNKSQTEDKKL